MEISNEENIIVEKVKKRLVLQQLDEKDGVIESIIQTNEVIIYNLDAIIVVDYQESSKI